ncbi:MAG: acyl-CoA thioesterase [Candidatus Sericytochromatia bacterium]|nr:acyl-CoA thioesterase [Candidatus Sericytochromatia bacterium]
MPFTKPIEVRYADCDMMQHVNNAVFLHYLEEARLGYYRQLFGPHGMADIDFILGEVRVRYLSPATMGEMLDVTVRVSEMRRSSFTMQYAITAAGDGRSVATAGTVQVMFDYVTQASKPLPDDLRARIGQQEGQDFAIPV